jgi:hypothetical protein
MSNAIQFLEALGANPASSSWDADAYAQALAAVDIDEAQHRALTGRDTEALAKLLDGRVHMLCMVATPDGGETQDEPDKSDEDGSEPDDADDDAAGTQRPG